MPTSYDVNLVKDSKKHWWYDCEEVDVELQSLRAEVERLTADNANLRAAVAGKTFAHSDEAVMLELGTVRAEVERLTVAVDKEQSAHVITCRALELMVQEMRQILGVQDDERLVDVARELTAERDKYKSSYERLLSAVNNGHTLSKALDDADKYKADLEEAQKTIEFLKGTCRDDLGLSACD